MVSTYALRGVVSTKDHVINVNAQILVDAEQLNAVIERKASALRGFLLSRDERFADEVRSARTEISSLLARLRAAVRTDEGHRELDQIERAEAEHQQVVDRLFGMRRGGAGTDAILQAYQQELAPRRDELEELDQGVRGLRAARAPRTPARPRPTRRRRPSARSR